MSEKKVIVIGAGTGGCAIAARLAKEGFKVTVYEKNSFGGGRCSLIYENGHRFDQGPSLCLMPKLFEETFNDLDEDISNHVELLKCQTNYNIYYHDGQSIEITCDLQQMCENLKKFEGKNTSTSINFLNFLAEARIHQYESISMGLRKNYPSLLSMFKLKHISKIFSGHIFDSAYNRAAKYFKSDHIRKAMTFQAMYIGMSPFDAPGLYTLIQSTEFLDGIWYPKGGFYQVLKAIENIATDKYGAKFIYNSGVKKINIENGKATGVTLEDGKIDKADIVICNADSVYAYNELLPKTNYGSKLGEKSAFTSSSISFYWCMKKKIPQLSVHNIFLAEQYQKSFDEIFIKLTLPSEASFYVNVPSRIDPTAAPENKDSIVVLVPIGHLTEENNDKIDELVRIARQQVIETIEKRLKIENFADLIEKETFNDPRLWREKFNLWKGSALGLTHNIPQVLCFRPPIKSKQHKNLYFCGASVHPGTGVPMVLCGAKLTSEQICKDFGLKSNDNTDISDAIFTIFVLIMLFLIIFKVFSFLIH